MSERHDLLVYDQMSAEELACVLRADLAAAEGAGLDMETLLYVMGLYADRQTVKPPLTAKEAYAAILREQRGTSPKSRFKLYRGCAIVAAAAVVVLALGCHTVANSRKIENWEPVFRQDSDYLMVSGNYCHEATQNVPTLAQRWYPQWLPEDYEQVRELRNDGYYGCFYQLCEGGEEHTWNIAFHALTAGQTIKFLKTPELVELYEHDGTEFYLYTNGQRNCAVGCLKGVVINVEGQLSREDLIRLIQSMSLR